MKERHKGQGVEEERVISYRMKFRYNDYISQTHPCILSLNTSGWIPLSLVASMSSLYRQTFNKKVYEYRVFRISNPLYILLFYSVDTIR